MCGITGWIHWEKNLTRHKNILEQITATMSNRGPDDAGIWLIFGGHPWFHNEELLSNGSFPWLRSTEQRKELLSAELLQVINPEQYIKQRYQETIDDFPGCRVKIL